MSAQHPRDGFGNDCIAPRSARRTQDAFRTDAIVPNAAQGIQHGTYAGWNAHRKTGVPVCDACRAASATYQRNYRATRPGARASDRYWNRTRRLALEQLATEYPERFFEILAQIRETVQVG